jgi:hypothetical protein
MCVFKYHAFIYFMRSPPWYGTILMIRYCTCGRVESWKSWVRAPCWIFLRDTTGTAVAHQPSQPFVILLHWVRHTVDKVDRIRSLCIGMKTRRWWNAFFRQSDRMVDGLYLGSEQSPPPKKKPTDYLLLILISRFPPHAHYIWLWLVIIFIYTGGKMSSSSRLLHRLLTSCLHRRVW